MAKNAEERYQSALGIKYDLEVCLSQAKETGKIEFQLGTRDICDRFRISEKLYGREQEIDSLIAAFDRVSQGSTEIILLAGFSGIGKTAVVNEVHKPIVRQSGYFIKGKYDQFQRNIPFSAFVQAFRDLMGQLLSESDAHLREWKNKILSALGDNGQVIIDVIPELERIIGQQPPVSELSGSAAQNRFNLWKALQEGLILPITEVYKFYQNQTANDQLAINNEQLAQYRFLHDRVQQAAYSLIPSEQKQATHLKIGRLLLSSLSKIERDEKIFDIVNQLNIGAELIVASGEKEQLIQLNLDAGCKALLSTAYTAAVEYFTVGRNLLATDSWKQQYKLTFTLYQKNAEAAYLSGHLEMAQQLIDVVLENATSFLDKIKVYEVKIQIQIARAEFLAAVNTAIQVLKNLNVKLPLKPSKLNIVLGLVATKLKLLGNRIETLHQMPEMTDLKSLAALRIMNTTWAAVFAGIPNLFPLFVFKQIHLSLKYGNAPVSAVAYSNYGLLCAAMGDFSSAYKLGQLALILVEKLNANSLRAKVVFFVETFIKPWKHLHNSNIKPLQDGYQVGLETGHAEYAVNCLISHNLSLYFCGQELQ